jgi:hypothetical protein
LFFVVLSANIPSNPQCLGVVSVVAGSLALPTAFLTPGLGAATIAAGVLQVLYGPLVAGWLSLLFTKSSLRFTYVSAATLGIFQLVLGVMSATKERSAVENEVLLKWGHGGYSDSFKDRWGSPAHLVDESMSHLHFLTVAELLSAALLLVGQLLLSVSIAHRLERHLTVVALATASKSESSSAHARRAEAVASMKAAMAADPTLKAKLAKERIPRELKQQKRAEKAAAKSKKYAVQHEGDHAVAVPTPHTRARKLSGGDAAAAGGEAAAAADATSPVERIRKSKKHKKSDKDKDKKKKKSSSKQPAANPLADAAGSAAVVASSPGAVPSSRRIDVAAGEHNV